MITGTSQRNAYRAYDRIATLLLLHIYSIMSVSSKLGVGTVSHRMQIKLSFTSLEQRSVRGEGACMRMCSDPPLCAPPPADYPRP